MKRHICTNVLSDLDVFLASICRIVFRMARFTNDDRGMPQRFDKSVNFRNSAVDSRMYYIQLLFGFGFHIVRLGYWQGDKCHSVNKEFAKIGWDYGQI